MQSRLVVRATRLSNQILRRGFSTSVGRTADPAIHGATDPEGKDGKEPTQAETETDEHRRETLMGKETEQFDHRIAPFTSSPRLKSTGVNQPLDPKTQQKRRNTTASLLQDVSCEGFDGSPLPNEDETEDFRRKRKEQEEDDKEYFRDRKASPLSEIKVADTRKPITKATDGTADSKEYGGGGGGEVIGWLPEQLDTAEEALLRATRIWKEAAMRGDPDSPQARVLRALRGEETDHPLY